MILREIIYIFDINCVCLEAVDLSRVDKSDRYYYESLLKNLQQDKRTELEILMDIHYDSKNVIQLVKMLLCEAGRKEKEHNKTNVLSRELINEFKESIYLGIGKNSKLISMMSLQNKNINVSVKNKNILGTDQLVPREIFFRGSRSSQLLSEQFSKCIESAIENNYINFLKSINKQCSEPINNALENINEKETYVILCNYRDVKYIEKCGYIHKRNVLVIGKNQIKILNIAQLTEIYLIRENELPIIELCGYDDKWNKDNIEGNYYFELNDCSNDEGLRKKLIENSKWLKEKGNEEEQDEYLKECCRVSVYYSYQIKKSRNITLTKLEKE